MKIVRISARASQLARELEDCFFAQSKKSRSVRLVLTGVDPGEREAAIRYAHSHGMIKWSHTGRQMYSTRVRRSERVLSILGKRVLTFKEICEKTGLPRGRTGMEVMDMLTARGLVQRRVEKCVSKSGYKMHLYSRELTPARIERARKRVTKRVRAGKLLGLGRTRASLAKRGVNVRGMRQLYRHPSLGGNEHFDLYSDDGGGLACEIKDWKSPVTTGEVEHFWFKVRKAGIQRAFFAARSFSPQASAFCRENGITAMRI